MTLSEFLARAWKAANTKARELGWIVLRNVRLWHKADQLHHRYDVRYRPIADIGG